MNEKFKCIHGIESSNINVILECDRGLAARINDALTALRPNCEWRKGDGYYVSGCITHDDLRYSHSATDEPEKAWKSCPYCGGVIIKPLFTVTDKDEVDPHG